MIKALEEATGLTCYPFLSSSIGECIVYTYEPIMDDGIKKQDRLTIRLITKDIPTAIEKVKAIKQLLLTIGDQKNELLDILSVEQNRGGTLKHEATGMVHTMMYFYLINKSEVIR